MRQSLGRLHYRSWFHNYVTVSAVKEVLQVGRALIFASVLAFPSLATLLILFWPHRRMAVWWSWFFVLLYGGAPAGAYFAWRVNPLYGIAHAIASYAVVVII